MSDAADNVVLNLLRAIRTTQLEHGHLLTSMEMGLTRLRVGQAGDAEIRARDGSAQAGSSR